LQAFASQWLRRSPALLCAVAGFRVLLRLAAPRCSVVAENIQGRLDHVGGHVFRGRQLSVADNMLADTPFNVLQSYLLFAAFGVLSLTWILARKSCDGQLYSTAAAQ
jgi:hypothetical protein